MLTESKMLFKDVDLTPQNGLVKTQHNQGYMTTKLDKYSEMFVKDASRSIQPVLEIGTAYGIATLQALKLGGVVIANDLHEIHLDILYSQCPVRFRENLTLLPGKFQEIDVPKKVSAILACRVLHFFTPEEIIHSFRRINNILEPGGKAYIICDTPYMRNWQKCIPEFEARKKNKETFPGVFYNAADYCENHRKSVIPEMVHWFDYDILYNLATRLGFFVEHISYINREGMYPIDVCLDGRESVGAILVKH